MQSAPIPLNEPERLAALRRYDILDTPAEADFDDFTRLASQICGTPMATIALIDAARQWFKSSLGMETNETSRDASFCSHTILGGDILEVPDALKDERFRDSPLVIGDPNVRFYAGAPLITPDGQNIGALCVLDRTPHNLTQEQREMLTVLSRQVVHLLELRFAGRRIKSLNAELEQRVVERTAQLEAFSYSVSHDLRAPLRHVMGFVELLQKDAGASLSKESLRYLTTISRAAKLMGNLIDDLLAFSRLGQSAIQKAKVILDQLVQETLGDFQLDTNERNISWEIHPLPAVLADRSLLRMVLVNLISNAVKFTRTRASAKIEIGSSSGADGETVIFVRDNGVGFDPQYTDKLFGVFQRLHPDDDFEGTGIGLANVHRIVHRHGGRVWAESAVGKGATFFVSLPNQTGARTVCV
jgi:signal transduction histidine kinase